MTMANILSLSTWLVRILSLPNYLFSYRGTKKFVMPQKASNLSSLASKVQDLALKKDLIPSQRIYLLTSSFLPFSMHC